MASNKSFQQKMQMASKLWSGARTRAAAEPQFGGELEDGRYVASLSSGEVTESQSSGRLQINWTYTILEGESKGEIVRSYDGLESEDNLMWLARKLERLGYDVPEDLDDVREILEEITKRKPTIRIRLKTKGEYQNVYIDTLLEEGTSPSDDGTEATPSGTEQQDLEVGSKVTVTLSDGKQVSGEVIEILEDDGKVRVKDENDKVYRVKADQVALDAGDVPEEPEVENEKEEEEEPTPRVTKRTPVPMKKKITKRR